MPRAKSWLARIVQITEAIEASEETFFKRSEVEKIFGIGASAANELMNVVGTIPGARPGVDAHVTRANLLFYLKNSREGQDALAELARRRRLAATLQQASADAKLRNIALPVTEADEWTRFADLPNISLEPGLLTVVFSDPLDLFAQLYRLAKAAGGDWDTFMKMCAPATDPARDPATGQIVQKEEELANQQS